ncbi:MAG: transcription antitermination factor NusB [Candidatus Gracilibacteria bacterium]|nr:transcription antitermination factor NusB [Candidatus Gracilibacteria bacterium]
MISIINRKKTRKLLYQELYASTFGVIDLTEFYNSFFDEIFTFERDEDYLKEMNKIIKYHEGFFIFVIKKYSPKFDFEKMNIVNIIPIYIALAEMFFIDEEIPGKVSVNEAIEVAKVYGDDSAKKIVNGVLNKVLHDHAELEKSKDNYENTYNYSIFKR